MNTDKIIQQALDRSNLLLKLKDKYPDLKIEKDRWGREFFISSLLPLDQLKFEYRHSCGCCADPNLLVRCFFEDKELNNILYYKKIYICIGKQQYDGTYSLYPDWRECVLKFWPEAAVDYIKILTRTENEEN